MKDIPHRVFAAALALATTLSVLPAVGQTLAGDGAMMSSTSTAPPASSTPSAPVAPASSQSSQLFDFQNSDIKFSLNSLMRVLRDSRHEGWVLAAYPDPKTSRPLIGAGFSLDVAATEHQQSDPLNPRSFLEPSSAQLWQAAGLDPVRLQEILDHFDRNLQTWKKKNYRRKIKTHALPPQVTEAEATDLLRISAVQAIHNARAYCRDFDRLTATQQMALSQLVFQMGVNLEEFVQFLDALNGDAKAQEVALAPGTGGDGEHWKTIQHTLIESQWARKYSTRAVAVIAMFDPDYSKDPKAAEHRVQVVLRPPKHHRKKPRVDSVRAGNDGGALERSAHKRAATTQ